MATSSQCEARWRDGVNVAYSTSVTSQRARANSGERSLVREGGLTAPTSEEIFH